MYDLYIASSLTSLYTPRHIIIDSAVIVRKEKSEILCSKKGNLVLLLIPAIRYIALIIYEAFFSYFFRHPLFLYFAMIAPLTVYLLHNIRHI